MQQPLRTFIPHDPVQIPIGVLTVQQVVDCFLTNSAKATSPRALEERQRILTVFCKSFGARAVTEMRPLDLLLFVNAHPEWKSDWTLLRVISTIQRPFHWAEKLQVIPRNPFRGVSHCQGEAGRPIEAEEFQTWMRNSGAEFRRVLIFLKYTGCRPGEMSSLEWSFVDKQRGWAVLAKHKTARTRRDRKPRVIVLHPVVLKLFEWIKRNEPDPKWIFVNARGRPWTRYNLANRIKRLRKKCGLRKDCRLYSLRHDYGNRAILNGVELKTLATLMGHVTTRVTERYTHIDGNAIHLQNAVQEIFGTKKHSR